MTSAAPTTRLALRGDLLDFTAEPAWGEIESGAVRFRPDHWLLIEAGRIIGAQLAEPDATWVKFADFSNGWLFRNVSTWSLMSWQLGRDHCLSGN